MARSKSNPEQLPALSRLEQDIMRTVWNLGECSSAEVIKAYSLVRPLAATTIRTVLTNLRKKGYLEQVPSMEPGYRFRPVVARQQIARRSLRGLLSHFFDDSPHLAISFLLKNEKMSDEELEELKKMIEERQKKG